MWLAVEKLLDSAADERRPRSAADEDDFFHVGGRKLRIGKRLFHGAHGASDDRTDERLEGAAREFVDEHGAVGQRETQRGSVGLRKLMLQGDEGLAQFLGEFGVRRKVDLIFLKNLLVDKRLQEVVDVVPAEMGVTVRREHLIDVAFSGGDEFEDGNVECAATEIVDGDAAALLFVEAVGERCGGRFIDEAEDFQAGDLARVFGGLTLCVVEIGGYGDHRAVDRFAKVRFRPAFQFAENEGGNLRRSENFIAKHDADDVFARRLNTERKEFQLALHVGGTAAHEPFHGIDGAFGLCEQAAARGLTDDNAAIGIQAYNRGAQRVAVGTRNTLRLARRLVEIGDQTVGCSEIDADDACHDGKLQGLEPLHYKSSF